MPRSYLSQELKEAVQFRAHFHCEYCCSPCEIGNTSCAIEHIQPLSQSGTNDLENLANACHGSNWHKSVKITGIDPTTHLITPLFNPRKDAWIEHFSWSDDCLEMIPFTSKGRATIYTLKLNRKGLINLRQVLILAGMHPPAFPHKP